jgi:phage shock protein A
MGMFESIKNEKPEIPEGAITDTEIEQPVHERINELEDEHHELNGNSFIQLENQYQNTQSRIDNLKINIEKNLYSEDYSNKDLLKNMIDQYRRSIERLTNLKQRFDNETKTDIENVSKIKDRLKVIENEITKMEKWLEMITLQNPDMN